jgi:type II secretory pathway pseudopilin PulG
MNIFIRKHSQEEQRAATGRSFPALNLNPDPNPSSAQPDTETWRLRLGWRLRAGSRRRERGHTLTELMVSMTIVLLVLAGVLSAQIFGLRLFELNKAKLGASDDARAAISHMVTEIRAAKLIRIGDGSASAFTEVAPNTPQRGSAIQVYPTTSTNTFVRYFRDSDQKLKRAASGSVGATIVASCLSNQVVFTSEDFTGAVLTNNENNRVIGLTLQFYQLEYPAVTFGPGNLYDYYQLRTKITRRALE